MLNRTFECGLILSGLSLACYSVSGYSPAFLLIWLSGCLLLGLSFYSASSKTRSIGPASKSDLFSILLLSVLIAPLYLLQIGTYPHHIATDEMVILNEIYDALRQCSNPLAISTYNGYPTLIFLVCGWLCQGLGDLSVDHLRLINALFAISIPSLGYLFFRQVLPWRSSVIATIILSANHVLVAFSRMNLRMNTSVILELGALIFLLSGVKQKCPFKTFLGGVLSAAAFYSYIPGRITVVIWILFTVLLAFVSRESRHELRRLSVVSGLAFIVACGPMLISSIQDPVKAFEYSSRQLLFTASGLELQMNRSLTTDPILALMENIYRGTFCFNAPIPDSWGVYWNRNAAFFDPLTGIFLWIGLLITTLRAIKSRRHDYGELLSLSGFFLLYFLQIFVINQAPNYPRILVILPFAAYLSAIGLESLAQLLARALPYKNILQRNLWQNYFALSGAALILVCNFSIYWRYLGEDAEKGESFAGLVRILSQGQHSGPAHYIVATSEEDQFVTCTPRFLESVLSKLLGKEQGFRAVTPTQLQTALFHDFMMVSPPLTIFVSRETWLSVHLLIKTTYPEHQLSIVGNNPDFLAVQIRAPKNLPFYCKPEPLRQWFSAVWNGIRDYDHADYTAAANSFAQALNVSHDLPTPYTEASKHELALARMQLHDYGESEKLLKDCLAELKSVKDEQGQLAKESQNRLDDVLKHYQEQKQEDSNSPSAKISLQYYCQAENLLRETLVESLQKQRACDLHIAEIHQELAAIYLSQSLTQQARNEADKALCLIANSLGKQSTEYATCLEKLAEIAMAEKDYAKAASLYGDSSRIRTAFIGSFKSRTSDSLYGQAKAWLKLDTNLQDAQKNLETVLWVRHTTLPEDTLLLSETEKTYGDIQFAQSKYAEAEMAYLNSLRILGDHRQDRKEQLETLYKCLRLTYQASNKHEAARAISAQMQRLGLHSR